ncbi:LysM domain receptor-like kinase 4 [Camellia lanceoleosa]|uniref:LysM domain receptor-like kinase 4 n=1 Tax=Camellia lanceoleosa TaxID=1840588 RepID=A0ACC0HNQ5_9ERIC|nr:LysM domain receptor-like kinase 4 [Camellia lanceoleosa]
MSPSSTPFPTSIPIPSSSTPQSITMKQQFLLSLFLFSSLFPLIKTQQQYSGSSVMDCNNSDQTSPSPSFLYTYNGQNSSCQAFLIFKSEPPYDSVPSISALTSSNPLDLAQINNVTRLTVFPTGKEVIVPVNCSCSGQYYQANTTFFILTNDTYFSIANNTFQGLSTCDSLMRANQQYSENRLYEGLGLHVPLRCACPTRKQAANGVKYLLTYSLDWDDNIPDIADRFDSSEQSVLDANGFLEQGPTLYPFTTILIPLSTEPSSLNTIIHQYKPIVSLTPLPLTNTTTTIKIKGSKGMVYAGVGIAAGSLLLLSIAIAFAMFLQKHTTGRVSQINCEEKGKLGLPKDLLVEIASIEHDLRVFEFEELKKGTDNFSSNSQIKGSVYRGTFSGEVLAVKKMGTDVSVEVNMLNKINHFNLITLHGICQRHGCFYLVFEYMANGSLKEWLHKKSSNERRSWSRRIQIALDVANGLNYLHSFTKPAYVHKDVKSSNVLLNRHLRAKIANFSLARTALKGTNSECNIVTTLVSGTRGYLAPEYIETGQVSPKIDVYAFGVVMLELITGKDAVIQKEGHDVILSTAVASIMEGENAETRLGLFIDPSLAENGGMVYALQVVKLSLMCLTQDPSNRLSMAEVVSALMKIQVDLKNSESAYAECPSESD